MRRVRILVATNLMLLGAVLTLSVNYMQQERLVAFYRSNAWAWVEATQQENQNRIHALQEEIVRLRMENPK